MRDRDRGEGGWLGHRGGATVPARGTGADAPVGTQAQGVRRDQVLTLDNVQRAFHNVGIEMDEHTVVVPGHGGH